MRKGAGAVDRAVAHLNVEHFRRLLADETDGARRQTILSLLAEEETKLAPQRSPELKRNTR
jgi:hypothetical protein